MVAIRMNNTNFTTDKAAHNQTNASSKFGSGRDIAYLVFSILQFVITLFTLFLVHYVIRKKDKKDESKRLARNRRDEQKRLEKEERDKIADIINNVYNKIVEEGIDEKLRKFKEKYRAIVMFYGREEQTDAGRDTITGLDVLRFMLHNPNDFQYEPRALRELQQDLAAAVKLFRSLSIKLPLRGDCPVNIKKELGPLITDVGKIARSFVSAKDRDTISIVLNYFGNGEEVRPIEDEVTKDGSDNEKTKRLLPYLSALSLGCPFEEDLDEMLGLPPTSYNDRGFDFNISVVRGSSPGSERRREIVSNLQSITHKLCQNVSKILDLRIFVDKINAIWNRQNFQEDEEIIPKPDLGSGEHLRANIIHSLRVFVYKVAEGSGVIQDKAFRELVDDMMAITYVQPSAMLRSRCEMAMRTIRQSLWELERDKSRLCEQVLMAEELERANKALNETISTLEKPTSIKIGKKRDKAMVLQGKSKTKKKGFSESTV